MEIRRGRQEREGLRWGLDGEGLRWEGGNGWMIRRGGEGDTQGWGMGMGGDDKGD